MTNEFQKSARKTASRPQQITSIRVKLHRKCQPGQHLVGIWAPPDKTHKQDGDGPFLIRQSQSW